MLLPTVTVFALGLWLVLWSIGTKAIDGFMLAILIILIAAGIKTLLKYLPSSTSD